MFSSQTNSTFRMNLAQPRQLNHDEDGFAVDLQCMDSGSQSVLVYATLYGSIVGLDLRAPGTAFRLENGLRNGVITTFCLDSHQSWLMLGTSNGHHVAWDLRFQLPIMHFQHPSGKTFLCFYLWECCQKHKCVIYLSHN